MKNNQIKILNMEARPREKPRERAKRRVPLK
jgi:hypothetical protein